MVAQCARRNRSRTAAAVADHPSTIMMPPAPNWSPKLYLGTVTCGTEIVHCQCHTERFNGYNCLPGIDTLVPGDPVPGYRVCIAETWADRHEEERAQIVA
eukprot:935503-Rhodomonas_salina.1